MAYSEKVMDHFTHPRNVGEIENADGVGTVGNAKCGDIMQMFIKVENNIITDVKFKTFGCGAAIATSSMATELIKGKRIDDALKLTNSAVVEALEGIKLSVLAGIDGVGLAEAVNADGSHGTAGNSSGTPVAPRRHRQAVVILILSNFIEGV